jgi:NADP-dependent 3-hydroxy acid dehydrogenase YdfG
MPSATQPLSDRLALVTGATSGIGRATALHLAALGARVVATGRRRERLAELAAAPHSLETLALDVRDWKAVEQALAGREFDVVVNNAGLGRGIGPLQDGLPGDWDEMLDTNVKGVLHVLRATLPRMLARKRGDHVILGSVAGRQIYPGGNVYCASKHAVRALYEALRLDTAGSGVRVSTVDPGMVETEFSVVRFKGDSERAAKVYQDMTPLQPADVADAVAWIVTRPPRVNVGELVLWPTDQASTTRVERRPKR